MKRALVFLLVLAALVAPAFAAGLIIITDSEVILRPGFVPAPIPPDPLPPVRRLPPPRPSWAALELESTKVSAQIKDQLATTSVEQEFYNPNARQMEGTFLFPVPRGAQIDKFTMEINGRPVEAELLSAEKARQIYEDIVRRSQDPALLEYAGRDLFKVRIFPIEPHARKRVNLRYTQLLKLDSGMASYALPLNIARHSAKPLKSVSLKLDLETRRPLKAVYSPSHNVEVRRQGAHRATVCFEASDLRPEADFQLYFSQEEGELGFSLLTQRTGEEEGFFLLLATPGADLKTGRVIAKDVAFVLDTSGSMAGAKLEQAKRALTFCVENLNDQDRFEVLRFATDVEALFDKLTEATADNRARARSFIKELRPTGGTAIHDALRKALAARPERTDRPFVVIFLTDGRPTVGVTDEGQIVSSVNKANEANTRVFCFGIGTDVNAHLLDRITEETRAYSTYVLPEEDIEVKVSNFYSKIKEPVLAGPKITFPDGVRVTKLYPAPLPDLFRGDQLVLVGRYSGQGSGAIRIEGTVEGNTRSFSEDATFPARSVEHEFIPRLWATRRVGYLLDEIRLRGESRELKDEVTELARRYNIVTPYTAYLIVEDEKQRGVAANQRTWFFEDRAAEDRMRFNYGAFTKEKSGSLGVGNARFAQQLKTAASADAISGSRDEALKGLYEAPGAAAGPQSTPSLPALQPAAPLSRSSLARREQQVKLSSDAYAQQGQFVAGKAFFQNNGQWVDEAAQRADKAKHVRVQFNSSDYFELLRKQPQAVPWLALGRNVQVAIGDTVYKVYE